MQYRKSLRGIEHMVVPNRPYKGLPERLESHHYYLKDSGHVLMVIPMQFREEAKKAPDDYEVGVPVKYVLSRPYIVEGDYIYTDVPYDSTFGITVPVEYCEYE